MAKRQTDEERVVNYFDRAPYSAAKIVFNIIRGKMRLRADEEEAVGQQSSLKPKKAKRSKRTAGSTGTTTMVSGEVVGGSSAALTRNGSLWPLGW
jgi:hypothetical protein